MTDDGVLWDEDGDVAVPRREFDPEFDNEDFYKASDGTVRWISGGCLSGHHIQPSTSGLGGQP